MGDFARHHLIHSVVAWSFHTCKDICTRKYVRAARVYWAVYKWQKRFLFWFRMPRLWVFVWEAGWLLSTFPRMNSQCFTLWISALTVQYIIKLCWRSRSWEKRNFLQIIIKLHQEQIWQSRERKRSVKTNK